MPLSRLLNPDFKVSFFSQLDAYFQSKPSGNGGIVLRRRQGLVSDRFLEGGKGG